MSLINGPTKIDPKTDSGFSLANKIPNSMALAALRAIEKATGIRMDPAPAYLFYVDISGIIVALFTECSGIGGERSVEVVQEGGVNDHTHVLPGQMKYNNITLKRGLSTSQELWGWFDKGKYDFKVKRVHMSIYQGGPGMNLAAAVGISGSGYGVVKQWDIENAYPVSWKLSDLNVNNTDSVAIESLEIAHSGISLSKIFGTPMSAVGSLT
jgi:phage tail-like protein